MKLGDLVAALVLFVVVWGVSYLDVPSGIATLTVVVYLGQRDIDDRVSGLDQGGTC